MHCRCDGACGAHGIQPANATVHAVCAACCEVVEGASASAECGGLEPAKASKRYRRGHAGCLRSAKGREVHHCSSHSANCDAMRRPDHASSSCPHRLLASPGLHTQPTDTGMETACASEAGDAGSRHRLHPKGTHHKQHAALSGSLAAIGTAPPPQHHRFGCLDLSYLVARTTEPTRQFSSESPAGRGFHAKGATAAAGVIQRCKVCTVHHIDQRQEVLSSNKPSSAAHAAAPSQRLSRGMQERRTAVCVQHTRSVLTTSQRHRNGTIQKRQPNRSAQWRLARLAGCEG